MQYSLHNFERHASFHDTMLDVLIALCYLLSRMQRFVFRFIHSWLSGGDARGVVGLSMDEILLRGCTLKNSKTIQGLVIYTGPETRIQQNSAAPPRKLGQPHCQGLGFKSYCHAESCQKVLFPLGSLSACLSRKLVVATVMGRDSTAENKNSSQSSELAE